MKDAMMAETISITGHGGDQIEAYLARPLGPGPYGGNWGGPGTPVSLTFLGPLYGEAKLLAFARAYQEATGFHREYPKV